MRLLNRIYGIALLVALFACNGEKTENLSQFVDPFIGTDYVGHTHPAAQLPFGMVQVGPDTGTDKWEHCSGYCHADSSIIGFSHTHLSGTGCPDMARPCSSGETKRIRRRATVLPSPIKVKKLNLGIIT